MLSVINKIFTNKSLVFNSQIKNIFLIRSYKNSWKLSNIPPIGTKCYSNRVSNISKKEKSIRKKDNVDLSYTLVYKPTLDNYVKYTQLITGITMLSVSIMGVIQYFTVRRFQFSSALDLEAISGSDSDFFIFLAAFLVVNALISSMAARFPLRIYHNRDEKKYLAIFPHFWPTKIKKVTFEAGDLSTVPVKFKHLPWEYSYRLGKGRVILLEEAFRTNGDLEKMLKKN